MSDRQTRREQIRQRFLAESAAYRVSSPLFSTLARASADDDDIVDLVFATRPGQSEGLLIFYVVHYLLLKSPEPGLAQYFPSLTEHPKPAAEAFAAFKAYCLEHRTEVAELLSWRTVNTNLAEKTSCLVPALRYVETLSSEPLTLLELCCSAGLNMLFDEYHHDYGLFGSVGPVDSPVQLNCQIIGSGRPPLAAMPEVALRVGVDLVKVDPSDPLEQLWMQAVLCPEWLTERSRLQAALSIRAKHDLRIIQGDALEVVGPLLEELPGRVCILMSYCIGHWSMSARAALNDLLLRASRHRDIHRLNVDPPDTEPSQAVRTRLKHLVDAGIPLLRKRSPFRIDHTCYANGRSDTSILAEGDVFGAWLDWHRPAASPQSAGIAASL